ncbi:hypothetical protein AFLA_010668 [Aspergillus flavus NRRL3357]|nr:hypothetical protein AFLA_010668 [Aspergillus flavus NRRL3357]
MERKELDVASRNASRAASTLEEVPPPGTIVVSNHQAISVDHWALPSVDEASMPRPSDLVSDSHPMLCVSKESFVIILPPRF